LRSLNSLKNVRRLVVDLKRLYLTKIWGMDIDPTVDFSLSARFDKTHPAGIHIGAETYIAFDAAILSHDTTRRMYRHTRIGRRCFIGARSIILPGLTIGDECIIGSGSVVTKDIPPNSIVGGNPARVIRQNTGLDPYGRFPKEITDQKNEAVS
jgi:acetyltransferase-like isoleucine patch superfamily enzyme